jgi:hypothetical protein
VLELNLLLGELEKLRLDLTKLINQRGTAIRDPEILIASKMLHAAIDKYREILLRKLNTSQQAPLS